MYTPNMSTGTVQKFSECKPVDSYPSLANIVHGTAGYIKESLQLTDKILYRLRSGAMNKDCAKDCVEKSEGLLSDAAFHSNQASILFSQLEEIARLIG